MCFNTNFGFMCLCLKLCTDSCVSAPTEQFNNTFFLWLTNTSNLFSASRMASSFRTTPGQTLSYFTDTVCTILYGIFLCAKQAKKSKHAHIWHINDLRGERNKSLNNPHVMLTWQQKATQDSRDEMTILNGSGVVGSWKTVVHWYETWRQAVTRYQLA